MPDSLAALRAACAEIVRRARHVRLDHDSLPGYAEQLPLGAAQPTEDRVEGSPEDRAAFWLTLDAINFGSGWFPTLRKLPGRSGYHTIATRLRARGPWAADELRRIDAAEIAQALGQDPGHELMELFARSLRDLGQHVQTAGSFAAVVGESAVGLAERLGRWECFADTSTYDGLEVPFLKRAQIAAADLHRAGVATFGDLDRLTMFADNLVPHVLRLDGVLVYSPRLVARIESGELIPHGSAEEVEIRAGAVHAVELIVAARAGSCAAEIDQVLWLRGQGDRYKAVPRHRTRCTAY